MTKVVIVAFAIVTLFFINAIGGRLEGFLLPVTSVASITRMEPVGETSVRIWGNAARLRRCSFDRIVWHVGDVTDNVRASVLFEESTKLRGDGPFSFGPWVVHVTPQQLSEQSFAVVYHRCHIFWLTQTRFFG